ncbi:Metallo-dependent phosphatase-like protein [Mycena galopus ATCC 62051]|nr:Metallo-dependent phosphatase-like protein [Mycena galopus ATCC 62051]
MPTIALPHRTCITSPTSVVQLEYPTDGVPIPKPAAPTNGGNWTRFVLLSDTHTKRCEVPDGDVLLHSGDLTQRGRLDELKSTMEWLYALPHPVKIIIAGNHDDIVDRQWYEKNWQQNAAPVPAEAVHELLKGPQAVAANIIYLDSEECKFKVRDGGKEWSVYGSPLSPYWGDWAFGYEREDGEAVISKFPKTDILLTHGPPRNVLDLTINKDRAGCDALAAGVQELKPKLHVFGHIHEARGAYVHRWKPGAPLPRAQNALQLEVSPGSDTQGETEAYGSEDDEPYHSGSEGEDDDDERGSGSDDGKIVFEQEISETSTRDGMAEGEGAVEPQLEETIFVNAANYPMGRNAYQAGGVRVKMGGLGFQPVIVDLLE